VSLAASQWALTVSLLSGSVATPLLGRLGDGRVRRPVTLATVAVMLAGCVLSALPTGFAVFLAGRALQITGSIPAAETGSAISFYQVARTVAYSLGSALSATVLVLAIPRGQVLPAGSGYSAAALVSVIILILAFIVSAVFAMTVPGRPVRSRSRSVPPPGQGTPVQGQ
jgi:MFS family permease